MVAEALWKKRPVIGGAALGIRRLLHQKEFARELGANGHQRVKDEFLITKNLKRYLLLLLAMDKPKEETIFLV
jgi:trehalose synthase